MTLPSPHQLKQEYPLSNPHTIASWRSTAKQILQRKDPRLISIVGPCSIHDPESALEYAHKLAQLTQTIDDRFFPIMRLFIEKPRTKLGWKGLLYDPHLNGTGDIAAGLRKSRELIVAITALGVPCATEILSPLIVPYFDDLFVWGIIGARTAASQPHREIASGLPFPIGFKNDTFGRYDAAIAGIITARAPHTHIGINAHGQIAELHTAGNPLSHLVLRGAENHPNYTPPHVEQAIQALGEHHIKPQLIIDCSHDNSQKNHLHQRTAFESVIEQASHNLAIAGFMLESHLFPGKQPLTHSSLRYGVSITDSCLGWEETVELLQSSSPTNSVQK